MNSRKRQAEDPLLPLHSAKQQRTSMFRSDGERSTASQNTGILSRWVRLGKEFCELCSDTVISTWNTLSGVGSTREPGVAATAMMSYAGQPPLLPDARAPPEGPPSCPPKERVPSIGREPTNLPTPVTITSSLPTPGPSTTYPSRENGGSSQSQALGVQPRKYRNREHIYIKEHKRHVRAEIQRSKEEMQKTMYQMARKRGYTSNFRDFKSLLAFQAHLEKLDRQNAFSPSSSLTDLHIQAPKPTSRRHSFADADDIEFLQRALALAQATLEGPPPVKPFLPSLEQLRVSYRLKDEAIERRLRPKPTPPSPLPPEAEAQVKDILRKRGIVSKIRREQVTDQDISRLKPCQWLNDEIINFYGAMIQEQSDSCKENRQNTLLNVHYFSTFFWPKLNQGYARSRLAKWTRTVDIFSKDVVLIPINHTNAHWTSAAINFQRKRIESYDSMGTRRETVSKLLRSYLDAEHQDKKKKPFDFTGWQDYHLQEPLQENGYDCGVFTCQYLQGLSRGHEQISFSQADMPNLRRRMIWEIGHARLRDEP